jgi:hypothetical protein
MRTPFIELWKPASLGSHAVRLNRIQTRSMSELKKIVSSGTICELVPPVSLQFDGCICH